MKTKLLFILVLVAALGLFSSASNAQTVHPVYAGENTLYDAIQSAVSGDVIELMDSGGDYVYTGDSDKIEIDKTLTIRALEGLAERPVIRNDRASGSTSTRNFEIISGSAGLTLVGLEFDGSRDGELFSKQAIRVNVGDSSVVNIKIDDCYFHDYTENFLRGYRKSVIDTFIVQNTISKGAIREGWNLYDTSGDGPAMNYVLFENVTIANVGREAIQFGSAAVDYNPEVIINHVTMDSTSLTNNDRVIRMDGGDLYVTNATIKNSIMSNQMGDNSESVDLYGTSTISYTDTFNVRPVDAGESSSIGVGMIDADPMYTDAANSDYTPMAGSEVIGAADDGYNMGDLRWDELAQGPTIHRVYAGENTLYDAIEAAESGDILELMDNGGDYVYTRDSDKIEIEKTLVIRARAGLTERPVIRNDRASGSSSTRNFEIISGSAGLTLIGLEFDGSRNGERFSKQAIRVNVGDSSVVNIKIEDCYFHDYTENFLRGYRKTVIDTLIVQNTISKGAIREGWNLYDTSGDGPAMNYVLFENVTISNVGREAIQFGSAAVGYNPEVIINHVTMDSTSLTNNDRVIRMDSGDLYVTNATIKNSIMSNQMGTNSESVDLYGSSTISYTDTFNVRPVDTGESSSIGAGMIDADPLYKDPSTGDYRLATISPARGAADDAMAMGDLRWEADPDQYILQVKTEGGGIVVADPEGPFYTPGSSVKLTADPNPGWKFDSWEGVLVFPPDNPVANVVMDDNKTVTAKFVDLKPKVSFSATAVGLGHIELNPEPVENSYAIGTEVTITAVADTTTWEFVEWGGALSGSENPKTFKVDSAMNVTAIFASTLTQFALTYDIVGQGDVSANPEPVISTYDTATVVVLTAEPAIGWEFAGWGDPLGGMTNPDTVQMDSNITLTVNFMEAMVPGGNLKIDTTWDLRNAVEFANNNSQVDTITLTTSGGVYTSYSTSDVAVWDGLTIRAEEGLAEMPIITNSDPSKENDDIFRIFDDFTLKGVILDGGHEMTHGPKYGIRMRNYDAEDTVRWGSNVTVMDCEFRDFFQDKNPNSDGHAFKIDIEIIAGVVKFERSTFIRTGYEAIRVSDTEKWATDRQLDSLIVRNCTFTDIDAEGVRYYSDADPGTPDAPVIVEHVTFDNTATRVMYLKNSGGAIVRDILITNSRTSGHGRDNDLMDAQGNTDLPSYVSHIDTFNVPAVPIKATDGIIDSISIYGFDPLYEDAENMNWTLMAGSPAYGAGHNGSTLGDLRWYDEVASDIDDALELIPMVYQLDQNYPNPFNPSTTIRFSLQKQGLTTLKIFDVLGRLVTTLIDDKMEAGVHEIRFENPNLATGVYFYHLKSGEFQSVKKMLLIK